jgi:cysteine-rich repeat protein
MVTQSPGTGLFAYYSLLRVPGCGDGIFNATIGEGCDDGNVIDGDGCSSGCRIEANDNGSKYNCTSKFTTFFLSLSCLADF